MTNINLIEEPVSVRVTRMPAAELLALPELAAGPCVYEIEMTDTLRLVLDEWQVRDLISALDEAAPDDGDGHPPAWVQG